MINCSINADGMNRAGTIYGPYVPLLKGNNVIELPEHTRNIPCVLLSSTMLDRHRMVDIYMDFFLSMEAHFFIQSLNL